MYRIKIRTVISYSVDPNGCVCNEKWYVEERIVSAAELEELKRKFACVEVIEELGGDAPKSDN